MIASLPMYDWPEFRAETDALWDSICDHLTQAGVDAPSTLTRGDDPWAHWLNPSLTLSQTCGLPYSAKLTGKTVLIGAPDYALADCPKGTYRSVIIARSAGAEVMDLKGASFAYNMRESQSGWAALDKVLSIEQHFGELFKSGAHRSSVVAVADGRADCASIDAVSWALAQRVEPAASRVHVIAVTPPTPGLPYITGQANAVKVRDIKEAVALAIAALPTSTRATLHLRGFKEWADEDYAPLAAGWPIG